MANLKTISKLDHTHLHTGVYDIRGSEEGNCFPTGTMICMQYEPEMFEQYGTYGIHFRGYHKYTTVFVPVEVDGNKGFEILYHQTKSRKYTCESCGNSHEDCREGLDRIDQDYCKPLVTFAEIEVKEQPQPLQYRQKRFSAHEDTYDEIRIVGENEVKIKGGPTQSAFLQTHGK